MFQILDCQYYFLPTLHLLSQQAELILSTATASMKTSCDIISCLVYVSISALFFALSTRLSARPYKVTSYLSRFLAVIF